MEVKDIVKYLNDEGFNTKVNDYGVIFMDVKEYGMHNYLVIDTSSKQIIAETPIHEEIDNKIVKPLSLLGLSLRGYPSNKRYAPILKYILQNVDPENKLLELLKTEIRESHE